MTTQPWDLKTQMLTAIAEKGGFVNCHGHFDKAFYITKERLIESMVDMEKKWLMSDDIKAKSTAQDVEARVRGCLDIMLRQGVTLAASFVDAHDAAGHKTVDAILKVKEAYKDKITLLTMPQPLRGVLSPGARALYEEIVAKCDIVGGLPSKDRPRTMEHLDVLFSIAKNLDKPLHVHIDQENNPNERDTEELFNACVKHGYEGRVVAVHAISTAAQPKEYRREIYRKLADTGIAVVVSPSAALSMRQLDQYTAPVHNSIANVPEMLEAGVLVGLGTDNIHDFYEPFVDGDMYTELRMLMESCRYYDFNSLADIASVNGRKILNMK
jgi:cytosine/adenosine deaminase-related metal-dependent hydrolase